MMNGESGPKPSDAHASNGTEDVGGKAQEGDGKGCFVGITEFLSRIFILALLLWNWDGFWQTNIGFLSEAQFKFFPEKHHQEQLKVQYAINNNAYIESLREENSRLEREAGAGRRVSRYFESAIYLLDVMKRDLSVRELQELKESCTDKSSREVLEKGKALLE